MLKYLVIAGATIGVLFIIALAAKAAVEFVGSAVRASVAFIMSIGSLFRMNDGGLIARSLRRWVGSSLWIQYAEGLEELDAKVTAFESALRVAGAWESPRLVVDAYEPSRFSPFLFGGDGHGSNELELRELENWQRMCRGTGEKSAALFRRHAQLTCEFPDCRPSARRGVGTPLPDPITAMSVKLPTALFQSRGAHGWKWRLSQRLYATERQEVAMQVQRVDELQKRLAAANARVPIVNERLQRKSTNAEGRYQRERALMEQRHADARNSYERTCRAERRAFAKLLDDYRSRTPEGLSAYFEAMYRLVPLLPVMPRGIKIGLEPASGVLIAEVEMPDLMRVSVYKTVATKQGERVKKPANKAEAKAALQKLHPLQLLRTAQEIASADTERAIHTIAVNGWVSHISKVTGETKTSFVASVLASAEVFRRLILQEVDPVASFGHLKGRSAFVTDDVVPVSPQLALDRNDPRFVEAREVLSGLEQGSNVATMPWEDFEHLIRDLFERLYASEGVEVKVTQASRDRGVDAVIFDPDPLRGGKIVIQAKRYINTVDVSAVRDLYGTVHNEGASRGILVTTSGYGADSYQFAKDKPLTLFNGTDLIALLSKVGHQVRINLAEARELNRLQEPDAH